MNLCSASVRIRGYFLIIILLSLVLVACNQSPATPPTLTPAQARAETRLISRNVPAFASSGYTPASAANDTSYDTAWRSQGTPAWLAYDLSSVPAAQRGKVLLVWYNETTDYDHTLNGNYAYNLPENYTIEVNASAGGGNPPQNGWVTKVSVTGNHYHSRQHLVDMTGDNWLRIRVTASDGAPENYDASLNMDVYNASAGLPDDWIFYGDSITAGGLGHTASGGVSSFAQLINAAAPDHFPVEESGGIGYLTSADGAAHIKTWLALFPGKYVALSYGTNDAGSCVSPDTFYHNYMVMVQAVLAAGKLPVVPHIPWSRAAAIQQCGPALNAKIDALYRAFPQIIKGPDFWAFFQAHQTLISSDDIHPTDAGFGAYRQQWARTLLGSVYNLAH